MEFTDLERRILAMTQQNLPDSATPFADVAAAVGCEESQVLELLNRLKNNGAIRRFGATLRHQKAGYGANAMVAWYVEDDQDIGEVGAIMASRPEISHAYHRRSCLDWPYNLYTMVHAKSREECSALAERLSQETGVAQYAVLFSVKEFKKSSMSYF